MKKSLVFIAVLLVSSFFHSCEKEQTFNENFLIGKWRSGTEYYKYLPNSSAQREGYKKGGSWDESDDVYEDEAQPFDWRLQKSELRHIHIMEMGGVVPKSYTVTELTTATLRYIDDFGNSFFFIKVTD